MKWGNTKLRVALALDTTGSMADDGKMDALKTATKSLLDQLKTAATKNGDVYVSIIPFSKDVNVGKSNYTENWIEWAGQSDMWDENNGKCKNYDGNNEPQEQEQVPGQGRHLDADQPQHLERLRHRPRPGLRHQEHRAERRTSTATLFPAEQYGSCPAEMMGLSYDWTALKAKVDAL